jgi:SET domain-containing protein
MRAGSEHEQTYLKNFSYLSRFTGVWVLPGDHDRYMNHSDEPNVGMNPNGNTENLALRDIAAGEELTCDYRTFDAEWRGKLGRS